MSSDFEIIEGLKKSTKNYVHDGYIYTKNNSDALKTRLRCRDWKDGCKGTAYIENGKFFVKRKCLHDRDENAINKQKIESKMKDMAGKTFAPSRQIYDEIYTITSVKLNFECQLQGCFFHYEKALWRKWVELGLSRNSENSSVQWLKLLLCLPFLPGDSIENAFFDLAPNKFFGQDVVPEQNEFYQYIEQYWFNKIPRELLSVHGCVRRTNSEVECYHWGLLRKIQLRHPNFWLFVRKLEEIAYSYSVEIEQANDGQDTRRKRCKLSITIDRTVRANEEKEKTQNIRKSSKYD